MDFPNHPIIQKSSHPFARHFLRSHRFARNLCARAGPAKKIEAAAEVRLQLPPNADAAEKLARYKGFLKVETHRLKLLHRSGADGRVICEARATILDALLRHL